VGENKMVTEAQLNNYSGVIRQLLIKTGSTPEKIQSLIGKSQILHLVIETY